MKPEVFIVRVPVKAFSKHDNPEEVARFLAENMKHVLWRCEALEGELPFDIDNITGEVANDGPRRSPEKTPRPGGADGKGNKRRTRNRVGDG